MKSICIIIPYFGVLPNYFSLWLKSAENNPTIHWLLVGDNIPDSLPGNITKIACSFDDMRARVRSTFDFHISLETPYKLCDYKPAYGLIFQNELLGYDFWGYGDVDLIYGDLRSFFTDAILNDYDRVFAHGHLSIIRNIPFVNSVFKSETKDCYGFKDVFSSPKSLTFDEWGQSRGGGVFPDMYEQRIKHLQQKGLC